MTKAQLAAAAANDNDAPVFDRAHELPRLVDDSDGVAWSPPRQSAAPRGVVVRYAGDGPTIEHRILQAEAGWYSSKQYSGQHVNDNQDWPLAKLLKTENNIHCLRLAERYRDLWNAAEMPCQLVGRDLADNIYLMHHTKLDETTGALIDKGVKKVTGKKAQLDMPATRASAADPDRTKKRAKPIPKKWNGDWPLLHHIDATRELAAAQAALGWLREAFEAAVCHGETLEAIGRNHGVGNVTGAKGAGRALVFLGLQCLDEFWAKPARRVAA